MIKICKKCLKDKKLSDFSKNARNADGLENFCISCFAENYQKNRVKIRSRQKLAWNDFSIRNSELLKEKSRKSYQKSKLEKVEYIANYKIEFAPKGYAKNIVKLMVKKGVLMKSGCEVCGEKKVDGHHDDYAKPLDVRWLCRRHHMAWHAENGEAPNGRALAAHAGQGAKA